MTQIQTLSELQPGQSATVRSVCAPDGMQRRLRDLGLIENTRVVCLGRISIRTDKCSTPRP